MANECVPYYEPGGHITGLAKAAVTGKRFLMISTGDTAWNPNGLKATAAPNVIPVTPAGAGAQVIGVAQKDVPDETLVTVICAPGIVIPVTSGEAVTHGTLVMSDATGRAVAATTTNVACGIALSSVGAADLDLAVKLFSGSTAEIIV